jgi:hypothetical protein
MVSNKKVKKVWSIIAMILGIILMVFKIDVEGINLFVIGLILAFIGFLVFLDSQ